MLNPRTEKENINVNSCTGNKDNLHIYLQMWGGTNQNQIPMEIKALENHQKKSHSMFCNSNWIGRERFCDFVVKGCLICYEKVAYVFVYKQKPCVKFTMRKLRFEKERILLW